MSLTFKKTWQFEEAWELFNLPFNDLLFKAHSCHRENFTSNEIQVSTLLSIKTGGCPENCSYCPQSAFYDTGLSKEALMAIEEVVAKAKKAKETGATRFCMGAAWRGPNDKQLDVVCQMVKEVKALGLETCVTLGLLKQEQAYKLKEAGLDYYNHNIDSSEEFYSKIITTRKFENRMHTLAYLQEAGVNICCGGIIGMGESNEDRVKMLLTLANIDPYPESVPINMLIAVPGTPLAEAKPVDPLEFIRVIALARILMPKAYVRLSAGRENMSEEMQAWCFFAGANSIFYGEKLLTCDNPVPEQDQMLFNKLGLKAAKYQEEELCQVG
jgi:biotin synthase